MIRELSRTARAALAIVMDARETASTSPPTLNGSLKRLPLNCAANFGGSTEKMLATLLGSEGAKLTDEELDQLQEQFQA